MENSPLAQNNEPFFLSNNPFRKDRILRDGIFYVGGIILFFALFYFFFLSAPNNFPKGQIINIESGTTLRGVSKELKERGIIRSRVAFEFFVILDGSEKHIAYGDYLFENKLPVFLVAQRISERDRHLAPIKVTIPEGYDVSQIADAFSPKLVDFNKDKFLQEANSEEGYLFPDTYFFFSTDNESDAIRYMSENFIKKIKPILPDISSSGKSEKDIITMASLIEREAKGDLDRKYISGILWNRIKNGMPLEVDSDMETYKNKGLPETPICNPGLPAIMAAIYPTASPYLFYLHDKDGNIHYATTFAEHKKNIAKYLN